MQSRIGLPIVRKLAFHTLTGAGLGATAAALSVVSDAGNVSEMIRNSSEPTQTSIIFLTAITLWCAVGATLTGFILIMIEESKS
jgi:hypothetical protein